MKIPLEVRNEGLYCPDGDFYIDAWGPVQTCLVTHAHGDHAHRGHQHYIATDQSLEILKYRLGENIKIQTYPYNQKFKLNKCWISFHPAGHILGSAQIRIETSKGVCVISGDYKRAYDPTCESFELIPCDIFVTESTFALPIYHWDSSQEVAQSIFNWWQENQTNGFCSVIYCYALGKAQRVMSLLSQLCDRPIYLHGAILPIAHIYEKMGIPLGTFLPISENKNESFSKELILAPPLAKGTSWNRRFFPFKTAQASGWLQVRGIRKQKKVDKGFVLSDHADWNDLLATIQETQASTILTTHGNSLTLARYLKEQGYNASPLSGMEKMEEGEG